MLLKTPITLSLALAFSAASLSISPVSAQTASAEVNLAANPFFQQSTLSLQYPPFDKIKDSDFAPAFDRGMAEHLKEIESIASNPAPATFDNTILAMERSSL